ncbi:hypothetical protein AF331_09280 [Rossellomorea marisflavi]|uniref:Uncharacterized protein n=1 Tax=Rossellomorea marisflavi TaxID=189381 RepID=A0A0M0GLB7_9BACI|nr:hypothetical protein [Rossellomorea marisflavi]KON90558.1 hypothetical protein AF331_09280 [Rossellomorea marisflavi]
MIKNKASVLTAMAIFLICMALYFPFPENKLSEARTVFMSFPITDSDGFVILGIIGSFLYINAIVFLVRGLKKYRIRLVLLTMFAYAAAPTMAIWLYQHTLASGIYALSYDDRSECTFESDGDGHIYATCDIELKNHSRNDVSFNLQLLDSTYDKQFPPEEFLKGSYPVTVEGKGSHTVLIEDEIDRPDLKGEFNGASSGFLRIKATDGDSERRF